MARKKRVPGHYNPDSNRIFNGNVSDESIGDSKMNKFHMGTKTSSHSHPREPDRRHCPHPWHSRFLRHNVRLLNEPFCYVATEGTDAEQADWWPSRTSDEPLKVPPKSCSTVQRSDFQSTSPTSGNTRHGSNPFTIPAKGILPVNEPKRPNDAGDTLLESISYKHGYNSRLDRNEPIRGKLHGSFVWDQVIETDNGKIVVTPWNKRLIHRCVTVPVTKQEQAEASCNGKKIRKESDAKPTKAESTKVQETPAKEQQKTEETSQSSPKIAKTDETPINTENSTSGNKDIGQKFDVLPPIDGLPAPSA